MRPKFGALMVVVLAFAAGCASARKPPVEVGKTTPAGQINLQLAQSYLQANDLETALDRANRALKTDPQSGDVHAMLGMIYGRIGDATRADDEYEQALKLAPTEGPILNAYGAWRCERGDFAVADTMFQRALDDPFYKQPEQTYYNAGRCALRAGHLEQAESYLRAASDRMPTAAPVLLLMARTEFRLGKLLEARAFAQRCDALGPNPELLDLAARIEDASGHPDAAADYRQRLTTLFPNYAPGIEDTLGGQVAKP